MKKVVVQLLAVAVIVSLLAVYIPMNFSDAGSGAPGSFDLQVTAGEDGNAYLSDPVPDGAKTVIKFTSDKISSDKTYVVNGEPVLMRAGSAQVRNVVKVTPGQAENSAYVEIDLTTAIDRINNNVHCVNFVLQEGENRLDFKIWFMTDKLAVGTLDLTQSGVPVLTLDPEKAVSNSIILVKGVSKNAQATIPGITATYAKHSSDSSVNEAIGTNLGYKFKLAVTELKAGDASFTDGGATYPFRIALVEHDQYDTLVIGTAQNPNVMTDLILDYININYVFKYSNPELSTIPKDVISKRLLYDDDTFDDMGYCLTISESENDDSILIAVNGTLSKNHLYRICLTLGTDESSYSFKVMFATTGHYNAVIDSSSAVPAVVEINANKLACDYVLLKGLNQDSALNYDVPGVEITVVKEDNTVYGDFLYLKIAKDKTKTTNEVYDVAVGSGESSYTFSMAIHTFVCLSDVNGFDYEIYSMLRGNVAEITWNLGEKDSLLIKVHLPDATSNDVLVSGSYMLDPYATIGYDWNQVEFEVREYSLEQRYAIFSVTALEDKAMHDGSYSIAIHDGGNAAKVIHVAVTNHVDVTVSFVSGAATLDDSWDVVSNERLTVRLDGMSEGKKGIIEAKLYKDGTEISDYSGMLSISCRCYDDGHASLMMIALDGIQEGLYKVSLPLADDDVYELTFSTVKGAVPPSQSGTTYLLEHQAEIRGSNVRLTLDIEKTSGEELEDARLLVIAKYQGGIVVNFYSKPSLVNGNGTDVIEVSQQNLVQVVVEMVDGFQAGNPVHYGWASYDA